jgi:hypothetical protein
MSNVITHLGAVSPLRVKRSERTQRVAHRDDSTRLLESKLPAQRYVSDVLAKAK